MTINSLKCVFENITITDSITNTYVITYNIHALKCIKYRYFLTYICKNKVNIKKLLKKFNVN